MPAYLPLADSIRILPPGLRPLVSKRMLKKPFCNSSVLVISRQTAAIGPLMKTLKTAFSVSGIFSPWHLLGPRNSGVFNVVLYAGQPAGPQSAVLRRPAIVDDLDWHAIEIKLSSSPFFLRMNECCFFEHAQVFHHVNAAFLEITGHVIDAAPGPILDDIEDSSPALAGERPKYCVHRVGLHK